MDTTKYTSDQREIIEDDSRFLQIIAAAGSGKTSTLVGVVQRELEKGTPGEGILVLSFTRKAAGEIRERIRKKTGRDDVRIHTFHAFCLYAISTWHPEYKVRKPRIVLPEEKNAFFRDWFRKSPEIIGGIPYELLGGDSALPENFVGEWKIRLDEEYSSYKRKEGKLDFDDLVAVFLDSLEQKEPWTDIPRDLLKRILVDEFQDTDSEQLRFLQLLSDRSGILVVGDDSQSIYAFRGADIRPFLDFPILFPNCSRRFLNTNFRSLPKIVDISSIPIRKNKNKIEKKVIAHRKGRADVSRIRIDRIQDLFPFLEKSYVQSGGDLKILCRSNHRIREYVRAGIPIELLMTIHASKGLEFHTIFVDLADGWNIRKNSPLETFEEEHRILYVALSRAKDCLAIVGRKGSSNRETAEDLFFSYFQKEVPIRRKG